MSRLARYGDEMKAVAAVAVVVVALLAVPLFASPASAGRVRNDAVRYAPIVEQGTTTRFDGGQFVHVRLGDISLGVLWSSNETYGRGVSLLVDYTRYFGGAQIYDESGNYLGTRALPLHTVLMQHFDKMVEFRDLDNDSLMDLRVENRTTFLGDEPVKVLDLNRVWYLDGNVEQHVTNTSAWVNFTLSASDVPYRTVYNPLTRLWRSGMTTDGVLDKISLTFHLAASVQLVTRDVPFYRVTVANGDLRLPTSSEFLENRTLAGVSIDVNGKYDQLIQGWDFSYPDSKLAMGTALAFGNFYTAPIVHWLQEQFGGACLQDGTFQHCESDAGPATPVRIARDSLRVAEGWQRAGDTYWTNNVTVDGRADTMTFEIYWAERFTINRGDALFTGFRALGAFVYPQGQTIVHDPGIDAASLIPDIVEVTNLTPSFLVGLELAVAAIALVPALLLRRRRRAGRP